MAYFQEPGRGPLVKVSQESYARLMGIAAGKISAYFPIYLATSRAATTVQEFITKKAQVDGYETLEGLRPNMLDWGFDLCDMMVEGGPTGKVWELRTRIEEMYEELSTAMQAGIWAGVGSGFATWSESWLQTGQLLYAYKTLAYHTAVTPRIRRRWNYYYYPNWPDAGLAFILHQRGLWKKQDFITAARYDGWSEAMAERIYQTMLDLPTVREGFYFWRKGSKKLDDMKYLYKAQGGHPDWWDANLENMWYTPTLYDLTRLADYIELPATWTMRQLTRRGLKDEDKARVWEMLQKRPLREEYRLITNQWLLRYRYGRTTLETLRDAFKELDLRAKERELLEELAIMYYADELIDEWIDILTYRFRNAQITEAQFLAGLIALNIKEEKANLIVEAQKARGYTGA